MVTGPERIVRSRRGWTAGVVPIGFALVLLGAWAIFAPLTGPYFGYGFDTHTTWLASNRNWELDIGPGILVWLGGAFLLVPPRPRAWLAALLAAIGGIWLIVGPSIYPLWGTAFFPFGSTHMRTLKWIGYFYGTGALVTFLAAFAQGMLSRSSYVEEHRAVPVSPAAPVEPIEQRRAAGGEPLS